MLNKLHHYFAKGFENDEWWNSTHVLQAVKDCKTELFAQTCDQLATDYISREDALMCATGIVPESGTYEDALSDVVKRIKKLPPATPTRMRGKWIQVDSTKCKCSKCEIITLIAQYPHGNKNFCPNCGSDNREASE